MRVIRLRFCVCGEGHFIALLLLLYVLCVAGTFCMGDIKTTQMYILAKGL